MSNAPTHCDECGKETSETFLFGGQNLCYECFDKTQTDAENVSVGTEVKSPFK